MSVTRTPPLRLTRNQLASFLKDHEAIKAFENLFSIVESSAPDATNETAIQAASAGAKAVQALSELPGIVRDAAVASAAAEARATMALQAVEALRTSVELLSLAPPVVPGKRSRYAQFLDTTTQTAAAINTAYPITYNTTDISYGVRLRSPSTSEIEVDTEGVYNFQFSIQIDKTSGGTGKFWIWPRINGTDVANSAFEVQIQGNNAEVFSAANFFFDLKAGDYVQFMWAVDSTSVQLDSFASTAFRPAVPSIILTVANNIRTYL